MGFRPDSSAPAWTCLSPPYNQTPGAPRSASLEADAVGGLSESPPPHVPSSRQALTPSLSRIPTQLAVPPREMQHLSGF